MSFPFDVEKALQAIDVIFKQEVEQNRPSSMHYIRLLKLLYIADRESLQETGSPITGDVGYAMDQGPVLSEIYNAMRDKSKFAHHWNHFLERSGDDVRLRLDPGKAKLCRYDIEKLREVTKRHRGKDKNELVKITHEFEEWKSNYKNNTSTHIPLRDVLAAVGFKKEEIEKIERAAKSLSLAE